MTRIRAFSFFLFSMGLRLPHGSRLKATFIMDVVGQDPGSDLTQYKLLVRIELSTTGLACDPGRWLGALLMIEAG